MVVTIDGIPVFDALISDESTGMFKISLVDDPAIQSNFLAFDSQRKLMMYSIENEEKRLVRGVVMRADFPIYRRDEKMGEYYVIYKADTIRLMAEKYLFEKRQNDVNLMHQEGTDVDGVQMVQYFIKDTANGVNPAGFESIADGSLFAEFHIVNDALWEAVKDGTFKGFSLEGVFDLAPEQDEDIVQEIVDELDGLFNNQNKSENMTKKERILAALEKLLVKFGSVTTDKGILVWDGDGELEAGMAVYVEGEDGERTPAPDGEYKTNDGTIISVADGKVKEVIAVEAPAEEEPAEEGGDDTPAGDGDDTPAGDGDGEGDGNGDGDGEGNEEENPETPVEGEDVDPNEIAVLKEEVAKLWEAIDFLKAALAGNNDAVEEMSAKLSKIANEPAAKPAHTEVAEAGKASVTGVKGLDNLSRILNSK